MRGNRDGGSWNAVKTHCPKGHEYTTSNTRWAKSKNGGTNRRCRKCDADRTAARRGGRRRPEKVARPVEVPQLIQQGDWAEQARCASLPPEVADSLFFPAEWSAEAARPAKSFCSGCPVRAECLEWALENDEEWGIFGGKTVSDRKWILDKRRAIEQGLA